ncbi:hypothetical protein APA_1389 [Pseudanabaena sp. lw0831]|nr:hypothetical protein APA_1389 [Pseudanabaena sp. lw0831]
MLNQNFIPIFKIAKIFTDLRSPFSQNAYTKFLVQLKAIAIGKEI